MGRHRINNPSQEKQLFFAKNISQLSVLGSDEVGNGSYFGPLTVCAAYVKRDQLAELRKLGVRDSKELKDSQIIQLADILKKPSPINFCLISRKYNEIQPKYNAVRMKVALHNQAIHLLLKKSSQKTRSDFDRSVYAGSKF